MLCLEKIHVKKFHPSDINRAFSIAIQLWEEGFTSDEREEIQEGLSLTEKQTNVLMDILDVFQEASDEERWVWDYYPRINRDYPNEEGETWC